MRTEKVSVSRNGGARPGAGRKKGVPNKASRVRLKKAADTGVLPLDVMLDNMRYAHSGALELVKRLAKAKVLDGESVVLWREQQRLRGIAQECAKDAAPYLHNKLASVEHSTPVDRPFKSEVTHKLDPASAQIIADLIK